MLFGISIPGKGQRLFSLRNFSDEHLSGCVTKKYASFLQLS